MYSILTAESVIEITKQPNPVWDANRTARRHRPDLVSGFRRTGPSWRASAGAAEKQAQFRDAQKTLDNFGFDFNKKMNRSLDFDLATGSFIARHEDVLFLGPPGTGKSRLA